jgi:hypothetical protein
MAVRSTNFIETRKYSISVVSVWQWRKHEEYKSKFYNKRILWTYNMHKEELVEEI